MDVQDFLIAVKTLEKLSFPVWQGSGPVLCCSLPDLFPNLSACCQGDVWICMELMDTSLDKFYKQVIEKDKTIPEDILGKIAVSVGLLQTLPTPQYN